MRILGVDPSFNRSGWAAIHAGSPATVCGTGIIKPSGATRPQQLMSIEMQVAEVLGLWSPQAVYFERPGAWQRKGGTRRETLEMLSMGRAAMLLACERNGVEVVEVDVHKVRLAMFGRVNPGPAEVVGLIRTAGLAVPLRPRGGPDLDICNAMVMCLYGIGSAGPQLP